MRFSIIIRTIYDIITSLFISTSANPAFCVTGNICARGYICEQITYHLGMILRFVYNATNRLWKFVFWRKAGRSGPVSRCMLHKSLFDAIPILPDLPQNFYRIFMLEQPSTFTLDKSLRNHFPRIFWFISCAWTMCWILASHFCYFFFNIRIYIFYIFVYMFFYMYTLYLLAMCVKLLIDFAIQDRFRRYVIRDKILDRNLFIILCTHIYIMYVCILMYVFYIYMHISSNVLSTHKIIDRILF